jgi:hypothetical protein
MARIHNLLLSSVLQGNITPLEAWNRDVGYLNPVPNVANLHAFGHASYVDIPAQTRVNSHLEPAVAVSSAWLANISKGCGSQRLVGSSILPPSSLTATEQLHLHPPPHTLHPLLPKPPQRSLPSLHLSAIWPVQLLQPFRLRGVTTTMS